MNVEQQALVLALPAGTVVAESIESAGKAAVLRRSEALARPARGSRTGQNAKVSLVEATIEHSPAVVDLSGPALADAMSDPHAPGHSRLIAGWLADFTSPHTRAAYYGDLLAFARYANTHGLNILEASKADVAGFKAVLEDPDGDHLSPASVARRISAVSSFYRHLEHEGITTANPALLVRRPKVSDESMTQALTRGEAARLLEAADTAGPRDHALICLLLLNGLRVSEVCAANISDLHTVEHHQVLKIRRKGGLVARTVLAPRTHAAVRAHIESRAVEGKPARGALLIDGDGHRLDRHDAARIVSRLTKGIGVEKTITPHSLRHTFVTTARAANIDVRDIQTAVGHADPRTTMRYDRTNQRLDAHPTYGVTAHLLAADT